MRGTNKEEDEEKKDAKNEIENNNKIKKMKKTMQTDNRGNW